MKIQILIDQLQELWGEEAMDELRLPLLMSSKYNLLRERLEKYDEDTIRKVAVACDHFFQDDIEILAKYFIDGDFYVFHDFEELGEYYAREYCQLHPWVLGFMDFKGIGDHLVRDDFPGVNFTDGKVVMFLDLGDL